MELGKFMSTRGGGRSCNWGFYKAATRIYFWDLLGLPSRLTLREPKKAVRA